MYASMVALSQGKSVRRHATLDAVQNSRKLRKTCVVEPALCASAPPQPQPIVVIDGHTGGLSLTSERSAAESQASITGAKTAFINVLEGRSRAETAARAARAASPRRQPRWCTAPSSQTRARPGGPRAAGARKGRAELRRRAYLA
eukprot:scaffold17864_cov36-Phaeocystis_antarctica.AAC.1